MALKLSCIVYGVIVHTTVFFLEVDVSSKEECGFSEAGVCEDFSSTSHSRGNQVDGLPRAASSKPCLETKASDYI